MAARKRRSLRRVLATVMFGLLASLVVIATIGYEALRRTTEARVQHASHVAALVKHADDLLTALVNQQVGLRGYLGTGDRAFLEPLDLGRAQEREASALLVANLSDLEDPALIAALRAVELAVQRWQRTIAEPQLAARATAPLPDLAQALATDKQAFDQIRTQHAMLQVSLHENARIAAAASLARFERIHVYVAAFGGCVLLGGVLAIRYLLRRTATPLTTLARRAEHHEAFPAPSDDETIHEVHALASSLHALDTQVRERERELAELHARAVELAKFGEFAQQVSDEDELHDAFVRTCERVAQPSGVNILVRNASRTRLAVVRPTLSVDEQLTHPILAEPMRCRAVRTMREVTANAGDDTACQCTLGVPAAGSHLCMPLLAAGDLIGVANLQSAERDHFDEGHRRALQGYASFVGGTVSSLQLIAATRERSLRDGLTGAYNRAFLAEYMAKSLSSVRRRGTKLALLMADLDHFKRINDGHGHLVGDQAIIALAKCLQAQTRTSDAVIRYGGEEFLVLLLDVSLEDALATAERIRAAVEVVPVRLGATDLGSVLRTSIGVAMYPAHGEDAQAVIAAADAALYQAKQQGRNRVVAAPSAT